MLGMIQGSYKLSVFECFSINSELDVPLNLGPNVPFRSFSNSHSETNLTLKEVL